MDKERIKESLEKLILPTIGIAWGGIVGTIDILTSGHPYVSGYFELTALIPSFKLKNSHFNSFDVTPRKVVIAHLSYLAGVAIPFGIKYHNEIYNLVEGILKWIIN